MPVNNLNLNDPNIDYSIKHADLNFNNYILQSKNIIATYRSDLNNHADSIIQANIPYELHPAQSILSTKNPSKFKYGALLIHGLLDTPFLMKDIGKVLQHQGMLVRSILLPGHGTVPGSLLNVKYEDWLQTVRYGVESLINEVEQIFLVGFSTGASLSIYHAFQHPEYIAGLVLLAPAIKINSSLDFLTSLSRLFHRLEGRSQWLTINTEIDYTKYSSIPYNAAHQVYRLSQILKKHAPKKSLPYPILMILSMNDLIVESKSSMQFFQQHFHEKNKMILYANRQDFFKHPQIICRDSYYPDLNILNFSHISLPISPLNPHYGKHGDYILASHVEENHNIYYSALNQPLKFYYDMVYKLGLIKNRHQRLTFNPDFDFMAKTITEFILQ